MTTFEGKTNVARYFYEGADPAQLTRVQNSHTDYPTDILLDYDPDGNLTLDEEKRPLKYDPLGRLIEVGAPPAGIHLSYGPDDLVAGETRDGDQDQRFYGGGTLANTLGSHQNSTFMRGDGYLLAEHQSDQTLLLATSISDSVLSEVHAAGINRRSYTVYGYPGSEDPPVGSLGYNGELAEADTGWQLLGNGYRAYNSVLMRFNSPDSWSPFGEGGVNAYAYVEGDPVNGVDPTGHFGIFTPFKMLFRAVMRTPTTNSKIAKDIPKLLVPVGNKKSTALLNIRRVDATRLMEISNRYQYKIDKAKMFFGPTSEEVNRLKQREQDIRGALAYMKGRVGKPGITGEGRSAIKKNLSDIVSEQVDDIRTARAQAKKEHSLDMFKAFEERDRFGFNPEV